MSVKEELEAPRDWGPRGDLGSGEGHDQWDFKEELE